MPSDALLDPDALSEYLGVPVKTIYNWRSAKKGPRAVKVGRHIRFRHADVEAWLESNAD